MAYFSLHSLILLACADKEIIKKSFATKVYIGCEALFFKGLCIFLQLIFFLILLILLIKNVIA